MKIITCEQIRQADAYTIQNEPIASIDLMERAASKLYNEIIRKVNINSAIIIFAGPGNNGGDALVVARLLLQAGYNVKCYVLHFTEKYSQDFLVNQARLENETNCKIIRLHEIKDFPDIYPDDWIIDGIFGSGLSRPLKSFPAESVKKINQSGANIISIDIPSGLFGEDNSHNILDHIIQADFVFSFQFPKLSFFFAENEKFVKSWKVVPIGLHQDFISKVETPYHF
ncbi:MAG: NAD(P)H-hydrate epimerase, partial [Marinilabiliales bacterium]